MDGGEERGCIFGVSRGNTAPAFEVEEGVFNQMPRFVKVGVVGALFFAVFLGRNDGLHALTFCPFKNFIRIVPAISDQIIRTPAFNQL